MTDADRLEELLFAISRGDREAFRTLFSVAGSKLFGVALRITRDRNVAEDALQEALVDIWRKAGDFDPARGTAMAWLNVIARNRAIDAVRRRGRGPALTQIDSENAPDPADPRAASDGGAEGMALVQCLGEMVARDRELVVLAYCEGYSREELSARFDAPVNTVKTWLRRGLASLKDCLEREI